MGDHSPSVSVCFFVFYLLIIFLHLAQVETKPQPKCPKEFLCSNRSIPTFPFTNQSLPDCGLFKLGCNVVSSSPPTLELDGKLYNTLTFGEEDVVVLSDPVLSNHLKNRSCDSFNWNSSTSFTDSPSISFEVPTSQFLFLFKCNLGSSHHRQQKIDDYFKGYKSYRKCKNFTLYYKENHHIIPRNKVPKDCSLVQLPFDNSTKSNDLFEELSPEIIFFWKLSEKCSECHDRGGHCQTTSNNNFKCSEENSNMIGRKRKADVNGIPIYLNTVLCSLALMIFMSLVVIFAHRHYKSSKLGGFSSFFSKQDVESSSKYLGVPIFSYSELQRVTNDFDPSKELGEGGFGTVYRGKTSSG
nr:LEAF RUST 10 DISEASE-RESISTANCE LOCUS RECEPTOR-LIKE PROTEIN KINASE-like 1.1 [Ipomoea batatas]